MPYVQVNDLDMFYEQMGTGDPVLFLHSGYSRGLIAFAAQLLDFQQIYTCYFPDFRGHGRTRSERLDWSTPELAEDMIGFMEQSAQDWRLYPQLTERQLAGIACPALFITGEHDSFAGEEKVKRLASLVQGSEPLVVPGGSHKPHMVRESPVFVNDAILRFLERAGQGNEQ